MKRFATLSVGMLALLVSACSDSGSDKTTGSAAKAVPAATDTAAAPATGPATSALPKPSATSANTELTALQAKLDKAEADYRTLLGPWREKRQQLKAAKTANDATLVASIEEEIKVLRGPYTDAKRAFTALEKEVKALESKVADAK